MFDSITDQNKPIARLFSMLHHRSVPHALLFTGIDGIGKSTVARAFSMLLNCRELKEDHATSFKGLTCPCRSCHKIRSATHPDILTVKPSGNIIKIAQIRELCLKLLVKPYEAFQRVVIIMDAHTMNPEASNALLKILEEPPSKTMFILITDQPSDLLPTILSRCQNVGFNPLPEGSIRNILVHDKGIEPEKADVFAAMAMGSMGRALTLCEKTDRKTDPWAFRVFLFDEITAVLKGAPLDVLLFAEKLSQKKDNALYAIEILVSFVRDLVVVPFAPERLINRDLGEKIKKLSGTFPTASLLKMTDHMMAAHQGIKSNASVRLCLEAMAIQLKRI